MKQILKPLIFALLTLLPTTALAHDFEVDGIYYNINGTEATVTCRGSSSYQYDNEYFGDVTIPATVTYGNTTYTVTSIGGGAFGFCSGLTSVTIPNSVTYIGGEAFFDCRGLTSITIPDSVTFIGGDSFYNCLSMDTVYFNAISCGYILADEAGHMFDGLNISTIIFGNSVKKIPDYFSAGLNKVRTISIPNSVTTIGDQAFSYCSGLSSITIPNSVTSIGYEAFSYCSGLTSVNISNSVTSIANGVFFSCNRLASIDIPNSVTSIGSNAFSGCSGLTSVIIPNSVTAIGYAAFSGCSGLTSVIIPNSVTAIGYAAFSGCSGLTSVNIPNSVTTIGDNAFSGCSGLTSVDIGNSVTSIGSGTFRNCSSLTSVTCLTIIPPTNSYSSYYGPSFPSDVTSQATLFVPRGSFVAYQTAYNWQDFYQIVGLPRIDDFEVDGVWYRALDENTAMVISRPGEDDLYNGDVVIPEEVTHEGYSFTVTTIDEGAFEDCYELNSVVIGDAVESIGENAFQGCTDLTSVTIGSGMTTIGAKAFNYCNALQTVTCLGTVPPVMANSNCFSTAAYSRAILKVPRPEIETYTATDYWYKFSHIEGWGYLGPGDVNGSGTIDMDDLTRLINIMLTDDLDGIDPAWADVTGNGIVSMNDLTELINILLDQ